MRFRNHTPHALHVDQRLLGAIGRGGLIAPVRIGTLFVAALLASCAAPPKPAPGAAADARRFYVMSNGWHTAIALPRRDIPPGALRVARGFHRGDYLVFGWG